MPLFTVRDRAAIAVLGVLILAGWSVRLWQSRTVPDDGVRIVRGAVAPPAAEADSVAAGASAPSPAGRIDLNRASAAELETLPMIGPKKAGEIIRWRAEHGPFREPRDLMKVRGIGEKTYDRVAPYIAVAGAPEG